MPDTYKDYFKRNLKKIIAKFGDIALLDEVAKSDLTTSLQNEIDAKATSTALGTVSDKLDTLVSTDTNKTARAIAAEEVAKIVASAPESFDTLKEIADWISTHSSDASAMNSAIVALQAKTVLGTYTPSGGGDPVQYATVKAYVEAYVAEQMASNITLQDLSATTTGSGNVVTAFAYDDTTGTFTATKGLTAIELDDLSIAASASGNGNVVTGMTYDNQTGEFTLVKGLSAATLASFSFGSDSGAGNVVTGVSYDNTTGVFTLTKGVTAITTADLVDLTDQEVDALFT